MKHSQRGSVTILLTILIFLVVVGIGVYIYYQNLPQSQPVSVATPTQTQQTTPIPTQPPTGIVATTSTQASAISDWKTYTNTQYGFSLTFPDSWKGYTVNTTQTTDPSNGDRFIDINFAIAGEDLFTITPFTTSLWSVYG